MTGHLVRRGQHWAIVLELGVGADGKRRQKWVPFHGTKTAAKAEMARLIHEMNTDACIEATTMTVGQYLVEWLAAKTNVTPKTHETYEEFVRKHFIPALGSIPLAKLTPMHIQGYYAQKLRKGRRDGKGGLCARSVLHHHRVLKQALKQAVKWQILVRNPADGVEPPRPEDREMGVLTVEQTARLLEAAQGTRLHIAIMIAVATSMRRGEVLGLRWQDVDLHTGSLSVRQSLQRTRAGTYFKAPKTAKSKRTVKLPSLLVEELRRHRTAQTELRQFMERAYQDHDLVVAQPDGTPFSPNAFSHAFITLVAKTGLPQVSFHGLRHSHATHLLLEGVHVKIVSERMGHSNIHITLDTYSHVLPNMQEEAAQRVDAALRAALEKPQDPPRAPGA